MAIISVEGAIMGGEGFVKHQIDRVREDEHVKAIVLRVDSPGGTVTGSDYIYHHLKALAKKADSRSWSAWAASRPAATTFRWRPATTTRPSTPSPPPGPARSA